MSKKTKNPNVGLTKFAEALSASIDKAEAMLGPDTLSLTPDEKRRTARQRKGGERVIQSIAEIAKAHGLDSPSLSSTSMLQSLEKSTTLGSALARIEKLQKRLSDEQFVAQNGAWSMALQFYAMLQRRATTDGTLAASLDPINTFFNYRHDSVTSEKPTKLQTRANAKLRNAERLVSRAKPRASVIESENEAHAAAPPAAAPTPQPQAPAAAPQPAQPSVVIVQQPAAAAPTPAVAQPAPAAQPAPQPAVTSVTVVPPTPSPYTNGAGASNGASNGYVNGAASAG